MKTTETTKLFMEFSKLNQRYGEFRNLPTDERAKIFVGLIQVLAVIIDVIPEEYGKYLKIVTDAV